MQIPDSFKNAIKNTFYDKTVYVYAVDVTVDAVGWAAESDTDVVEDSFLANVRFDNLEQLQLDYGIQEVIDVAMTTEYVIENGKRVSYLGVFYKVNRVIKTDSHYLITAQKWLSKSSTSISS